MNVGIDEIYLRSSTFNKLWMFDDVESVIWTEKYFECGDFEIHARANKNFIRMLNDLKKYTRFITRKESDMIGIVEKITVKTGDENGDYVTISGRCAVSILTRRTIVNQKTFENANAATAIKELITENLISDTSQTYRNISIINMETPDTSIFTDTLTAQYFGSSVYKIVTDICRAKKYGIKAVINTSESTPKITFKLYKGIDRSHNQSVLPRVTFSDDFDNLAESEYSISTENYANVTVVAGEGEGSERRLLYTSGGQTLTVRGLNLSEIYVDARSVSSNKGKINDDEYFKLLEQRSQEALTKHAIKMVLSAKATVNNI